MAKFAIGDVVKKDKGGSGVVRAIFTTMMVILNVTQSSTKVRWTLSRKPDCWWAVKD